ncbi:MAG: multidrug effflux MFS transporter [Woeseiaceae bacterium]
MLAAITAVSPLVMQMYLPALPSLAGEFGASASAAQLTFSAFVFTVGPAQLIYGPIADAFGRRRTALLSLSICLAGSVACAFADSMSALIGARVLQAMGSAGGMVVSRAVLSDRYGYDGMAARLSSVVAVIVMVPMIAPLAGGYVTEWFGWRMIFAITALYIAVVTTLAWAKLPETLKRVGPRESFVAGAASVFRKPVFLALALQSALSLSVFYAFIAIIPYVMENLLGLPPTAYGQFFMILAGGYLFGTLTSSRVASRAGMLRMVQIGTLGAWLAAIALFLVTQSEPLGPWHLFLPMTFLAASNGLASPSMQSAAVLQTRRFAGTASGIIGCSQQLFAGLAVQLVAIWGLDTPYPLVVFIVSATTILLLITVLLSLSKANLEQPH